MRSLDGGVKNEELVPAQSELQSKWIFMSKISSYFFLRMGLKTSQMNPARSKTDVKKNQID